MEDQLVELVTAKLADEKGFNIPTLHAYDTVIDELNNSVFYNGNSVFEVDDIQNATENSGNKHVLAPTQSLLQKWLREVHNIDIVIYTSADDKPVYFYDFKTLTQMEYIKKFQNKVKWFDTYELALEDAFKIALKKIK